MDVRIDAQAKFTLKQTDPSSAWTGITVYAEYGSERLSVSDFPPLPTVNTVPAIQGGDGYWRGELIDGKWAMVSRPEDSSPYIYYNVKDTFLFDIDKDVTLSVEYYDPGLPQEIGIDYDSHLDGPGDGAFHRVALNTTGEKGWRTQTVVLPRAWFKNRENGATDLRLSGPKGAPIRLGRVEIVGETPGQ